MSHRTLDSGKLRIWVVLASLLLATYLVNCTVYTDAQDVTAKSENSPDTTCNINSAQICYQFIQLHVLTSGGSKGAPPARGPPYRPKFS